MDLSESLQRKVGPLPVWAWGGVVGGSIVLVKILTGGGDGASSPFVSSTGTKAQDGDFDFGSGGGGGGGGGGTVTPLPTPNLAAGRDAYLRALAAFRAGTGANPGAFTDWAPKVTAGTWNPYLPPAPAPTPTPTPTRTGGTPIVQSLDTTRTGLLGAAPNRGDTSSTPAAAVAMVPADPIEPLGSTLALPVFDGHPSYPSLNIDSYTPIASSARIVSPPVSGGRGSVAIPSIPTAAGAPPTPAAVYGRARARAYGILDRIGSPNVPPTVARARLTIPRPRFLRSDSTG